MAYPVIFIHGMWCTGANWKRITDLMAPRGYDCHAVTLPGHEPGPDQPLTVGALSLRSYLAYLEDYVARQGFKQPPIIIGHSMGGLLAQQLAARTRPLALVLVTPAPPAGILALSWSNIVAFSRALFRWGFWRKPHKPTFERAQASVFNTMPVELQRTAYASMLHESGRALFEIGFWQMDFSRASAVDSSAVRCPVYVISAEKDKLTPASVVRKVATRYASVSQRYYMGRGHWVIDDEETEEMVNGIISWLRPFEHRVTRAQ
jgi:pimeloyl-ACP methyl ester carboxylesterase